MTTFVTPPPRPEICRPLGDVLVEIHGDQAMRKFVRMVEYFRPAFPQAWVDAGVDQIIEAHTRRTK